MSATPEQLHAAGSAARDLLRFALTRQPRIGLLVITGITSVAKTLRSDVAASTDLLSRLIEPEHLRAHGHEELRWLTMNIQSIIENNPEFAVDIFKAIYSYEDTSDSKTSIGDSNILKLTSNRRQYYQSAWYLLSESIPGFLEKNLVSATRAVARSLTGYVQRTQLEPYGKDLTYETFSIGPVTAKFVSDTSYAWYRSGGYKPVQDAPVVLTKFEAYLAKIASEPDSTIKLQQILTVLAAESGLAVLWASLLLMGAGHPERFASPLMPLALAEPMMLGEDTRYQLGQFSEQVMHLIAGARGAMAGLMAEVVEDHVRTHRRRRKTPGRPERRGGGATARSRPHLSEVRLA